VTAWIRALGLAFGIAAFSSIASAAVASDPGARCVACHPKQVESYRATGMARALGPLVAGELDAISPAHARVGAFEYRFETSAPGPRIVESLVRVEAGRETRRDVDSAPIAFTVGAGFLDRSYAVRRGEVIRFGPLEAVHDAQGNVHAQPAPGHAIDATSRWNVPIAEECLRCHTSSLPPRDYPYDLAPPASWQPSGIDCDACHARAGAHATWQTARAAEPTHAGSDPIASDATARRAGFDSCARCHLQGDALLSIAQPLRGIPNPESDLFAQRAVFVAADPTHEIGFVSHVERLTLSACFLARREREVGALLCTTCHDPHRSSMDAVERVRVRDACSKCHVDGDAATHDRSACSMPHEERGERSCVDCHMRRTGVFDVAGVEIHDHRIERKPPPPSPRAPLRIKSAPDGRIARILASGERSTDRAVDPGLWMMAHIELGRRDLAHEFVTREPGSVANALASFHHLRAGLREEKRDLVGAEADLRRALAIDPTLPESSVNLGGVLLATKREREAIEVLSQLVVRHPKAEGALRNRAVAYLSLGEFESAVRNLEEAHRILPRASIAKLLGQVHERLGRSDLARRWADTARALEPNAR